MKWVYVSAPSICGGNRVHPVPYPVEYCVVVFGGFVFLISTYYKIVLLFRMYLPRVDWVGFQLPLFPPTCP